MRLEEIRKLAEEEIKDIDIYIYIYIKQIREKLLNAPVDYIHIPQIAIPKVENYCDVNQIPFYHVCEGDCTIARTYTLLFDYESTR